MANVPTTGEKQLLCLCRNWLNKRKVIIIDEGTDDDNMRSRINTAITEHFEGCTVIMIAHRLETAMFCKRI